MEELYPMLLLPAGKDYLWGGERLKKEFHKKIDMVPLAETWECSVHPDGLSVIRNGVYTGLSLKAVIDSHPEFLGTKCDLAAGLPILIKFIDAKKNLSVQVHPDDEYARIHENDRGKSEMWYVLDAEPEARLIYGFEHPVNKKMLLEAVENGDLDKHLHKVPVHKGDVFYIPAGTVHAIGAGILVAEIQESSNLTYRVYDYNRIDAEGKKRKLHLEKAMRVLDMNPVMDRGRKKRLTHYYPGCSTEMICRCKYFEAEYIRCNFAFDFTVRPESYQVLLCIDGTGQLDNINFTKGDCIFLPAGIGKKRIEGACEIIKVRC